MPQDPNRTLIQAVDRLTAQVRRIADLLAAGVQQDGYALAPPPDNGSRVVQHIAPPPGPRCVCGDTLQWYTAPGGASGWIHEPDTSGIVLDAHKPRPANPTP